jgi:hypothetical protein
MSKDFNVYKWRRDNLTENQLSGVITKSLKDVVWDDVKGLNVPTMSAGVMRTMDDRDMFSDEWRESTLNNWKKEFPNQDIKVIIDRSNPTWFDKVKIDNEEYNNMIKRGKDAIQADYDKNRGRYQGD